MPEVAVLETVADPVEDEYRDVVRLANVIQGDGFDEITIDDVQKLVEDDEVNAADLVTMTNEALSIEDSSDDLSAAEIKKFSRFQAKEVEECAL